MKKKIIVALVSYIVLVLLIALLLSFHDAIEIWLFSFWGISIAFPTDPLSLLLYTIIGGLIGVVLARKNFS